MARLVGISQQNYNRYESGICRPKAEALHKIATHFRLTVDELLNSEHNAPEPRPEPEDIRESTTNYLRRSVGVASAERVTTAVEPCPACPAKDAEIAWLRETVRRLQENFAAALAALDRKDHKP
jgi:transcriptional regulator with XRE-family HTH domain